RARLIVPNSCRQSLSLNVCAYFAQFSNLDHAQKGARGRRFRRIGGARARIFAQPPRLRAIITPKMTGGTAMAGLEPSYVFGASDRPLIGKTVGQFFDETCAKWESRPALVVRHQKVRLSYGELRQAANKLAAGLLTLGLNPGDCIGIWSPNNS